MKEELISVIVPIYNVEKYLRECIDSVVNQTYSNLEIILVDDGSPDGCGKICEEYAEKDGRISVVHKTNGGLSDARNCGLLKAKGKYLVFVDSDDIMPLNAIWTMVQLAENFEADIVMGGTEKFDDDTKQIIWSTYKENSERIKIMTREDAFKDFFVNGCASWARLYKRQGHKDIMFPVGEINEDEAIVLKVLENCNRIVKTNEIVYRYRFRKESITSSKWNVRKLDWCEHCKKNLAYIVNEYPDLVPYAQERYISSLIWALNNMSENPHLYEKQILFYRKELKNNLKYTNFKSIHNKERIRAYCLAYFFDIYSLFIRLFGKHYT